MRGNAVRHYCTIRHGRVRERMSESSTDWEWELGYAKHVLDQLEGYESVIYYVRWVIWMRDTGLLETLL